MSEATTVVLQGDLLNDGGRSMFRNMTRSEILAEILAAQKLFAQLPAVEPEGYRLHAQDRLRRNPDQGLLPPPPPQ